MFWNTFFFQFCSIQEISQKYFNICCRNAATPVCLWKNSARQIRMKTLEIPQILTNLELSFWHSFTWTQFIIMCCYKHWQSPIICPISSTVLNVSFVTSLVYISITAYLYSKISVHLFCSVFFFSSEKSTGSIFTNILSLNFITRFRKTNFYRINIVIYMGKNFDKKQ